MWLVTLAKAFIASGIAVIAAHDAIALYHKAGAQITSMLDEHKAERKQQMKGDAE